MKGRYVLWLGEKFGVVNPKSFYAKGALWIGSICLTLMAFGAISDLTSIPVVIVAVGWLVLTGALTTSDGRTHQLLKAPYQKGVAWVCIFIGSAYVLLGYASILMDVVTAMYWTVLFASHNSRHKGRGS